MKAHSKILSHYLLLVLMGVLLTIGESPLLAQEAAAKSERAVATPGEEFWDDRFNVLGVNGYVRAIAVSGTDVYVGGLFNSVGGVAANNIARWSSLTGTWSTLGGGVSGAVLSIAVSGSDVYVGGYFSAVGGVPSVPDTQGIARWNTSTNTWSSLGTGVPGYVYAIAVDGTDVYAGGLFNAAGGVGASNIARYDTMTNTWSALGSGTGYKVFALVVSGDNVYVGGYFAAAGNVQGTQSISRWNSVAQTWSALDSGIGGYVYALAVNGDDLYVGGLFNAVNGFPSVPGTQNIARWNSNTNTWSALGSGVSSYVYSLAVSGNEVYVGGLFNAAGGVANTRNIARWDGASWAALGSGVGGYVYGIAVGADGVYAGGLFNAAGDKSSHNFGLWHGNLSDPPDPNDVYWDDRFAGVLNGSIVNDIAVNGENVYVGGYFENVDGLAGTRGIVKWNSQSGTWSSMGNGIDYDGIINTVAVIGNNVYIGGDFNITSAAANYIARWNGNSWSNLGFGVNAPVIDIEINGDDVYVLGKFVNAGGYFANGIARWNSVTGAWSPLGSGVGFYARDMAIMSDGSVLVALGSGGASMNFITRWDGNSWTAFGNGLSCCVDAIAVSGSTVYIGGSFTESNGAVANHLAMGNGGTWMPLGSDLNDLGTPQVQALALRNNELFVGGKFSLAGEVSANNIAKWDGNSWSALASGLDGISYAIAINDADLYAGGAFSKAGNKPSTLFALWHGEPLTSPGGSISGKVTGPGGIPLPGMIVQICPVGSICAWSGVTDADGNYYAYNLIGGDYTLMIYPHGSASYVPAKSQPLPLVSGGALSGQDIQLSIIQPLPFGTSLTPGHIGNAGILSVDWNAPLQLSTQGCEGGAASYQIAQDGVLLQSGSMEENSTGQYMVNIPPLSPNYGYATGAIAIQCPIIASSRNDFINEDVAFTLYVAPSGVVKTIYGEPIPDATMTLYSFEAESGNFTAVLDGDAIMSPVNRTNPDLTDANGQFSWDVVAGFYKIRVEKAGCVAPFIPTQSFVETDVLVIPPAITDLDLRLDCGDSIIYLSMIHR